MKRNKTLGSKILFAMLTLVLAMLLIAIAVFGYTMRRVASTLEDSNRVLSNTTGQLSSGYVAEQVQQRLLDISESNAALSDNMFTEFKQSVRVVSTVAERIYASPEDYLPSSVPLPDASNNGKLAVQALFGSGVDPEDPAIKEELALAGNIQDTVLAVNSSHSSIASVYLATESGITVQADYISGSKFSEDGSILPLEAKQRPWYRGAALSGQPYYTPVTKDYHTGRLAIMCGIPVYKDGVLKGVAGAGMYLDQMANMVQNISVGESGLACIINGEGHILFSTTDSGTFAVAADSEDLRKSADAELADLVSRAVFGRKGVELLNVDGAPCYVAFSPLKTVEWTLLLVLPKSEVEAPTQRLLESLDLQTDQAMQQSRAEMSSSVYRLLGLIAFAVVVAVAIAVLLSRRIVKPIKKLTQEVSSMEGGNLDFSWDEDTGDETQVLATNFQSLTERVKKYIEDMKEMTAEQERLGTELALATRIQAAMLPSIFPPFPNRAEFDIYASMDPAREVGGDFYDFFFMDDDHLCLVIADVSGKGVPAALFMTISKIIIQSYAKIGKSPAEILSQTNAQICENNPEDMFVTVWIGVLEISTGKLTAANAGHEYPAVRQPGGKFELLKDRHGCAVGAFEDEVYKQYELQLEPGSKIFVYTDGLPEAKGSGGATDMFGLDRMIDTLNEKPDADTRHILAGITDAVADFVKDEEQFDDLTMLCLEYKGPGA